MPTLFKELARICGEPNWDQCTGHGLRRYLITCLVESGMGACDIAAVVRHSSLNSQLHYAKHTGKRATGRTAAIRESASGSTASLKKKSIVPPVAKAPPVEEEKAEAYNPGVHERNQFSQHPIAVQAPAAMKIEPTLPPNDSYKAPLSTPAPVPTPRHYQEFQQRRALPRPPTPPPTFPGFPQSPQFRSMLEEVNWRRSQMDWAQQYAPVVEVYQPPPPREVRMARSASFDQRSQGSHSSRGSFTGSRSEASLQGNPDYYQNRHGESRGRF